MRLGKAQIVPVALAADSNGEPDRKGPERPTMPYDSADPTMVSATHRRKTHRPLVLAALIMAMFMAAIEATIVATALPTIAAKLGGLALYSWVFSAFLLMQAVSIPIYGKLSDLFGRKHVFIVGILIFLVGSALCGMAWSMPALVAFRFIQGIGAGAVQPLATTLIGDLYTLEERGRELGLKYIELPGDIGVLANGAGLTMTTMDVIEHYGGAPANFLEIGGEAYTKATAALELVLANPRVKSLIVNFCGAFARTDVMAEGVVRAWETLQPTLPVFFSVHGTGEEEAVRLIRERLELEPFDRMEDAVRAAVAAAR